ncbi:MAG: hypothetical protein LBI33_08895 [Propionibacteriaceae bacterium]|jgi:hypothetical protein|nr:hypothetical protein [Propionibacteriaceae bacterium]
MRVFTNLDLNGTAPLRTQPELGEWAARGVVPTRRKRRARWLWVIGFVLIIVVLFLFGHWVYGIVMGSGG